MFEDSTFESAGKIRTRSRGWMAATFTFNGAVLLALVLFPLLHPEALPRIVNSILMTVPPQQPEPPRAKREFPGRETSRPETMSARITAPSVIPRTKYAPSVPEPPMISSSGLGDLGTRSEDGPGVWSEHRPGPSVRPEPSVKARVSRGIMDGLLVGKVLPEYPPIARAADVEGTVVLQAAISKTGTIENLRVVSGPALLRGAAMAAVRQWRYRPYLLNGEPVEVETTVNVQFTLD